MSQRSNCGDVLMVPLGLKGHITPMIQMAKELMNRGITITMIITTDLQVFLDTDMELTSMNGFHLQLMPCVKNVSAGQSGILNGPVTRSSMTLESSCEPFLSRLLVERQCGVRGPKCIIADQFVGWTQIWADKLNIPRYVSFPSPATFAVMVLYHSSVLAQTEKTKNPDSIISLLGVPDLHRSEVPVSFLYYRGCRDGFIKRSGESYRKAAGMLFNTFYELESKAIDAFRAQVESTSTPGKVTRMLPIGPMLPSEFFSEGAHVGGTVKISACLEWLDAQLSSSVLYIAFGSGIFLSAAEVQELAHGLESSQVPFLWILRTESRNSDVSKLLPPGFQARTKVRGLVITEFAPQLQILSHPATGGFLTHCGWNSSLEGISRGIPMVGWPMRAEQALCCRVLVDELKTAIEFKKRPDGSVGRGEVERATRVLMAGSKREELKNRISELQLQARTARAPGGSSHTNFEWLVKEITGQQ